MGLFGGGNKKPVPKHLKGQHRENVDWYYACREKIGDPATMEPEQAVPLIISFIMEHDHGQSLKPEACKPDHGLAADYGLDELDIAEATLQIESAYDGVFQFPSIDDAELSRLTVGSIISAVKQNLP